MVVYRDTSEIESMEMIGNSPVLVHLYKLATEDASEERICNSRAESIKSVLIIFLLLATDNDDAQQDCVGSHHWVLPHKQFSELWEQLVFDSSVKLDVS